MSEKVYVYAVVSRGVVIRLFNSFSKAVDDAREFRQSFKGLVWKRYKESFYWETTNHDIDGKPYSVSIKEMEVE